MIDKIERVLLGRTPTPEGSDIELQEPSSQHSTGPTPSLSAAILEDAIAHQAFPVSGSDEHGHIVWAENVDSRGPTLVDGGESSPEDTSGSPLDRTTSQDSSRTRRSFGRMARSAAHYGVSSAYLLESAFILGSRSSRRLSTGSRPQPYPTFESMPVLAASLSMEGRSGGRLTAKERGEIGGE